MTKKYIIRKKNNIVKYAKFCREVNCVKYAYYSFENEKKKLYYIEH